jgi:hypothetical protein
MLLLCAFTSNAKNSFLLVVVIKKKKVDVFAKSNDVVVPVPLHTKKTSILVYFETQLR